MIPYMSFSSAGYHGGRPKDHIIDLHKFSAFYLKKNFGEVHFITDSKSKDFFKDIPWTSISTELDIVPQDYPEVWSLSKLYAYKLLCAKGDPFIHSDYDVVTWEGLPKDFLSSEVFVQCPENMHGHGYEIFKFDKYCPNKFNLDKFIKDNTAYNMGIFGGHNLSFIANYTEIAMQCVFDEKNKYFWKEYNNYGNSWCKAVLAEQYFLYSFAKLKEQKITCLFNSWPTEDMAKKLKYSHIMSVKNCPEFQNKIKILLEELKT